MGLPKKFFSSLARVVADPLNDFVVGVKYTNGVPADVLFPASQSNIFKSVNNWSDWGGGNVVYKDLVIGSLPAKAYPEFVAMIINSDFYSPGISNINMALMLTDPNGDFNVDSYITGTGLGEEPKTIYLTPFQPMPNATGIAGPNSGTQGSPLFSPTDGHFPQMVFDRVNPMNLVLRLAVDTAGNSFSSQFAHSGQISNIVTVGDVAGSLGGKYWTITMDNVPYYIWYNTGSSIDPAPVGFFSLEVNINIGDSAATVAWKTALALQNNYPNCFFWQNNNVIRTQDNTATGYGAAVNVNAGFTITNPTLSGNPVKKIKDLIQGQITTYVKYTIFN